MTLNPATDREQIQEALKAASLDEIRVELARRSTLCDDMGSDCLEFEAHEEDPLRKEEFHDKAMAFFAKGRLYHAMTMVTK